MSTLTESRHKPVSSGTGTKSKAMLSSALQKANTAVLLDNANNIEGAMEAYSDACALLGHVMMRAGVDEDRRKLMQIRETYTRRIEELRELSPLYRVNEKELPARPLQEDNMSFESDETASIISQSRGPPQPVHVPPRRESLLPEPIGGMGANGPRQFRREPSHEVLMEDEEDVPDMRPREAYDDFRGSPRKDTRKSYIVGRVQSPQLVRAPAPRTSVAILAQPSVVQIDARPRYTHQRDNSLGRITQQQQQQQPPQMPPPTGPPPRLPPQMPAPSMPPPSIPAPQTPLPVAPTQSLPPQNPPPQLPPPQIPPPAIPTPQIPQQRNLPQPTIAIPATPQSIVTPKIPMQSPVQPQPKVLQTPSPQKHRLGHSRDVSEASTSWLHNFDDDDGTESPTSSFGATSPSKSGIPVPYSNTIYDSESEMIGADIDAAVDAAWDGLSSDADSDFEQGVVMTYGIKRITQQPLKLVHAQSVPTLRKKSLALEEMTEEEEDKDNFGTTDVRKTVILASKRLSKLGLDIDIGPSFEDSFDIESPPLGARIRDTALLDKEMGHDFDDMIFDEIKKSQGPAPLDLNLTIDMSVEDGEPTPAAIDIKRRSSNIIPTLDTAFQPMSVNRLSAQGEVESSADEEDEKVRTSTDTGIDQLGEFKFDLDTQPVPPPSESPEPPPTAWSEDEHTLPQEDDDLLVSPPSLPFNSNRNTQRFSGVRDRRISGRPASGLGLGPLTIETNNRHSRLLAATGVEEDAEGELRTAPPFVNTEENKQAQQSDAKSDTSGWNASTVTDSEFSPRTIEQNITAAKLERNRNSSTDDGSSDHTHIETLSPRTRQTLRGTGGILRQTQSHVNLKSSGKMGNNQEGDSSPGYHGLHSSASSQNLRSARFPPRTPMSSHIGLATGGLPTGGFHLFDSRIHSPTGSRSADPDSAHPVPLEPMPTEQLSKTFWLMRCLNNTISNPHGGYLSKKLFVPREIWLMKGVKLKGIDEKIAASDSLTVALKKLATVDKSDADLLLKELQDLETVMSRAETVLSKKLGGDVGPSGAVSMFKGTDVDGDSMGNGIDSTSNMKTSSSSSGGRSYWKKLRSKNTSSMISSSSSYTPLPSARSLESYSENITGGGGGAGYGGGYELENGDGANAGFVGPFASYMNALSKLFDAAQVLDQLAIHIEGNNLHIKTQVGLDLCMSRAGEFFGLYVCRFVLADVTILLDKYLKRASEWVVM
ncbi:hypothetical protein ABW19_dt0200901 [Dactylella cylindrospora]|nr:hypothetical protein ABW19_dt0200901 [Dactylella cylindrospora]